MRPAKPLQGSLGMSNLSQTQVKAVCVAGSLQPIERMIAGSQARRDASALRPTSIVLSKRCKLETRSPAVSAMQDSETSVNLQRAKIKQAFMPH